MSRQQTLHRQDLFGFVPGGPVLDTEMAYGGYDPGDWNQRRGGPVVAEEEEYGDDDHFSLHDEDDDVSFGGDLEDVPLFGGEKDKVDDQLDEILSEMDKDDDDYGSYGADPMRVAPEVEALREDLTSIIVDGYRNAFWGEANASSGAWAAVFRRGAEYVSNKFEALAMPGDMEEIAQALLAHGLAFGQWYQLSDDDRKAMVRSAIEYAAVPGVEHGVDDAIVSAWNDGMAGLSARNAANILSSAFSDAKKTFYAALAENPLFGNLMQAAGVDPENADQMVNFRAILTVAMLKVGMPIDAYIASSISEHGQAIVQTVNASAYAHTADLSAVSVEAEVLAEDLVAAPVQTLPDSGYRMPPPEQILAFGYGVTILGSLAGILR